MDVDMLNPTITTIKASWQQLPEPVKQVAPYAGELGELIKAVLLAGTMENMFMGVHCGVVTTPHHYPQSPSTVETDVSAPVISHHAASHARNTRHSLTSGTVAQCTLQCNDEACAHQFCKHTSTQVAFAHQSLPVD